ncbi:hypothetical protein SCP_0203680 [Sparassis crispa]|uniref:Uncharacterized protein n=1 Tax=Sparassis crispa TaxID=139825 RepID=A0A401GAI8_9APHY|nr:hypothetical protein SCP_0203680 [Sparassis crispa]GBE79171.1 hypothetical protein SCP_0203680 [Sparassis crispa]
MQHVLSRQPELSSDWYGVQHTPRQPIPTRSLQRKSPAPPSINLDDCKPILPTTRSTTGSGSSSGSSTAFVFTSSRTTRHHHQQPDSQPSSPSSMHSVSTTSTHRGRPALSPSQLARHSEGAVDTRNILGPNMRAAGFVHLSQALAPESHAMLHGSSTASSPQSPGTVNDLHTPSDPPPFPPILFVNPSVVGSTPMWEYQRSGPRGAYTVEKDPRPIDTSSNGARTSTWGNGPSHNVSNLLHPAPIISSSRSSMSGVSSSSGTLVSSSDSISKSSSVHSLGALLRQERAKGKAVERDFGLDEYPFPRTFAANSRLPPKTSSSSKTTSTCPSNATQPIAIPIEHTSSTASTTSTTSRHSHQPHKEKPKEKLREKEREKQQMRYSERTSKDKNDPMGTPSRAKSRYELSITELCETSPFAWTTPAENFVPLTHTPRRAPSSSASSTGSVSGTAVSISSSSSERSKEKQKARELSEAIAEEPEETNKENEVGKLGRRKTDEEEWELSKDDPKAHRREKPAGDRGRDVHAKALAVDHDEEQRAKETLSALVHARKERDRERARHAAAARTTAWDRDREREWERQQRRVRAKEKNAFVDTPGDAEIIVDVIVPNMRM